MAQIYEADEIVEVDPRAREEDSVRIFAELADSLEGENVVSLPVYYPSAEGEARVVRVIASLRLIEDPSVIPAPIRRAPVPAAPIAVQSAADPALAVRKAALSARLSNMREAIYSRVWPQDEPIPVPVAEEPPVEEAPSLAEVAEQIVAESAEREAVPALSVESADSLRENAAAFAAFAERLEVAEEEAAELIDPFAGLSSRTFAEKLALLPEAMRVRFDALDAALQAYEPLRIQEGKKYRTYKSGRVPIVRMAIRGKTLSAYVALDPKVYAESKYVFTDESESAAFANYPMRMRLSSDRQERWVEELIAVIAEQNGIRRRAVEAPAEAEPFASEQTDGDPFARLKRKPQKTFKQKLRAGSKLLRARYKAIKAHVETLERVRVIEGSKSEIYRCGSVPIAKLVVKGKTLNAYLALPPAEYAETKYIFTDVSETKAYERYPMRVRLSSDRQEKWVKELVDEIAKRANLKKKQ